MKTEKSINPIKNFFLGIFVIVMFIPFTSCAKKITFLNSTVVPAANGFVKVKKDNNKNYTLKIEISDLAEVERVQKSKSTYVVWMETNEGYSENLGQLKSSTSFLSKRHTASLKTASSYKPIKIFITTGNGTNVQYPSQQVILTTKNFKVK